MDAGSIAEITNLSADKVRSVLKSCNQDQSKIEHAINLYLENGSGPFASAVVEDGSDWAEKGKPRRAKKVRCRRRPARGAPWQRLGIRSSVDAAAPIFGS